MENELIKQISQQTELLFYNMEICMKTYDRDVTICGSPSWRYIYHTLHSCDMWYRNPFDYTEPESQPFDRVDTPCVGTLTDSELWDYFAQVKEHTMSYLAGLTDAQLYEKPKGCDFSRLELVLGQFRHFMAHIGIINGITIERTGRYPNILGLDAWKENKLDGKLFDE